MTTPLDHLTDAARAVGSALDSLQKAHQIAETNAARLGAPEEAEARWHARLEADCISEIIRSLHWAADRLPGATPKAPQ